MTLGFYAALVPPDVPEQARVAQHTAPSEAIAHEVHSAERDTRADGGGRPRREFSTAES